MKRHAAIELKVRIHRWAIEFQNEFGPRIILWHYTPTGSSAHPVWQWDFKKWPVVKRERDMPRFVCTGIRIAPAQIAFFDPTFFDPESIDAMREELGVPGKVVTDDLDPGIERKRG